MPEYIVGQFPGDRPEKLTVRAFAYLQALSKCGLEKFRAGHHLVLGGGGGDIEFLLTMGVAPDHIHVAEYDARVCGKLRRRFPEVTIRCEDVLITSMRLWDKTTITANLDFCGKISTDTVDRIAAVVRNLRLKAYSVLMVTLCSSREQEQVMRDDLEMARQLLATECTGDVSEAWARSVVLYKHLRERITVKPISFVSYISRATKSFAMSTTVLACNEAAASKSLAGKLCSACELDVEDMAVDYRLHGFSAPEIAPLLGQPRQRVAGWYAKRTRDLRK
jgi:uncharacterized protein YifN (PemK superfamily)